MKKLIILVALMLTACDDRGPIQPTDVSSKYTLPKVLTDKGCIIYTVEAHYMPDLYITYCPNSQVTTSYDEKTGRKTTTRSNVVIDGIEYEARVKPE